METSTEIKHLSKTLFSKDTRGNIRVWNIEVITSSSPGVILRTTFGQYQGKMTSTQRVIITGKNIGKSNETTPLEQAISQANSFIRSKKEEGYIEDFHSFETSSSTGNPRTSSPIDDDDDDEPPESGSGSGIGIDLQYRPMLAHDWSKLKKYPEYPIILQPKLDGIRMVAFMEHTTDTSGKWSPPVLRLLSRNGKPIHFMKHIEECLLDIFSRNLPEDIVLDGELYTHELTFEEITSLTRRSVSSKSSKKSGKSGKSDEETSKNILKIQYHIFDCFQKGHLEEPFTSRYSKLSFLEPFHSSSSNYPIQLVPSYRVHSKEQEETFHERFTSEGYEGTIYRIPSGIYRTNYRSKELLKRKDFITKEYTIVGAEEGTGRDSGSVIWKCCTSTTTETGTGTEDTKEFLVRPRGSLEKRREYFTHWREYVGKNLTVRYQNLTEYGVPRFPVGIAIRDYE
jgi:ATP-dependent DNA ligase